MHALAQGSRGLDVKNAQTALNYHLPDVKPPLIADGIFGPKTLARVTLFQQRFNLSNKPIGVIGPQTHRALFSFVQCSHHLLYVNQPVAAGASRASFALVGDGPAPGSLLPPLPRLQLPYPTPFRTLPPVSPPRLVIDPNLLRFLHTTKFELEAGGESSLQSRPGASDPQLEVNLFTDLKATIWSKPISENVELSAGGGFVVEKRLKPVGDFETSVYIFAKAEVKNILKFGPIDLAKLEAEAQIEGKIGKEEPPDMTATVGIGPEVELFKGALTFGPGAYAGIKKDAGGFNLFGKVKLSGTFHF